MSKFAQRLKKLERGKPCEDLRIKIEYVTPDGEKTPGPVFIYFGSKLIKVIPAELWSEI